MLPSAPQKSTLIDKPIGFFLLGWTLFNALQAFTLPIHADEAYYWIYSRFLAWGYFDHPPMVAVFIRIGDTLIHNELGLRLLTVLSSSAAIYLLWQITKKYATDALLFILVVSCILIFNIYGFITTPDAPLFFFTVVFYFFYQRYIERDSVSLALILGIVVACLLYSKYQAILVVVFTLASNLKLLKRWSFWLIAAIAVVLYVPHILWQFQHGFPSINYHLYDRSASKYIPDNTFLYIPGQLLMAGPFIGWYFYYCVVKVKIKDAFTRCLMVNCIGTLAFFFISTFRGEAQPQWTLIAFAPLLLLVLIYFSQNNKRPAWFFRLAIINIGFILFMRVSIMFNLPPISRIGEIKSFYGFKGWAKQVKQHAGDAYVIMADGFQNPAKYCYYTNSLKGFSYDSRYYRLTQFDIWPIEARMQHTRAYYLQDAPNAATVDTIAIKNGKWYGEWVNDVRTYQQVKIETDNYMLQLKPGAKKDIVLLLTNPYPYTINFGNSGELHNAMLEACFFKEDVLVQSQQADSSFNKLTVPAGASRRFLFTLTAPAKKMAYDLSFSIRTTPFEGGKNSRIIHLIVN